MPVITERDTPEAVRGTLAMLRYFRDFLRTAMPTTRMKDISRGGWRYDPVLLDKRAARQRLTWLVDVAINRRAGIPDHVGRVPEYVWRRDQQRVHDALRRVRVYQFETDVCRRRFSHLLSRHDD